MMLEPEGSATGDAVNLLHSPKLDMQEDDFFEHPGGASAAGADREIQKGIETLAENVLRQKQAMKQLVEHNKFLENKNEFYMQKYQEFKVKSLRKSNHQAAILEAQSKQIVDLKEKLKHAQVGFSSVMHQHESSWKTKIVDLEAQLEGAKRDLVYSEQQCAKMQTMHQELNVQKQQDNATIQYLEQALQKTLRSEKIFQSRCVDLQRSLLELKTKSKKVFHAADKNSKLLDEIQQERDHLKKEQQRVLLELKGVHDLQDKIHFLEDKVSVLSHREEDLQNALIQQKEAYQRIHELYLKERREKQILLDRV